MSQTPTTPTSNSSTSSEEERGAKSNLEFLQSKLDEATTRGEIMFYAQTMGVIMAAQLSNDGTDTKPDELVRSAACGIAKGVFTIITAITNTLPPNMRERFLKSMLRVYSEAHITELMATAEDSKKPIPTGTIQ